MQKRIRALDRVTAVMTLAWLLCAALAELAGPAALLAQAITPEQVVSIEQVGAVAVSPDGKLIAYTSVKPRSADEPFGRSRSELWIIPAEGGAARPIVEAPRSASAPQWSPDGSMLAFSARLQDNGQTQVYGVRAAGGEPDLLTHSPLGVMSFAWSPDGRSIAYTAREPEPTGAAERRARGDDELVASEGGLHVRLWVEDIETGQRRAVTSPDVTVRSFVWTPSGQSFAIQVTETTDIDASYMFRRIYTVPANGGDLSLLTTTQGKLGDMAWSPDGRRLAFIGAVSLNDPLAQSLFVVSAAGGEAANRTQGYEASVQELGWLDNQTVYFVAAEGTRTTLNRVRTDRGRIERMAGGGAEILNGVSFDARHRTYAAAVHTSQHPPELYTGSERGGELRRLTRHNPWLDQVELARQETIAWPGADGWTIEGVLVHPLDESPGTRYPLAILPHGGPEGISFDGWTTRALYPAQVLAARGYVVLMPNYRGSGGRGVAFSKGDHRDLGGKEFLDVIAGIDYLAQQGLVDPDRVGMSGTSYGGYFSALAATKYSHRFKAAIPYAGISNWVSFTGTTDIPYEMSIVHWDTWWFEDPGLAWDRSPLAHVNDAQTATLVGHGMADERVHPGQSIELYTALRIKGVPTDLVLYPREPHGLLEREHQLDFMRRILEWFDKYLKGTSPTTM
jgi:dipeptidyl aminopeptidase/acylaminoacyl peptidase